MDMLDANTVKKQIASQFAVLDNQSYCSLEGSLRRLVFRRPFDAVDDEEGQGGVGGFDFEAELGFESSTEVGGVVGDGVVAAGVVNPGQGEVVEAGEASPVDDGVRD